MCSRHDTSTNKEDNPHNGTGTVEIQVELGILAIHYLSTKASGNKNNYDTFHMISVKSDKE
jgi:hypothetical protein